MALVLGTSAKGWIELLELPSAATTYFKTPSELPKLRDNVHYHPRVTRVSDEFVKARARRIEANPSDRPRGSSDDTSGMGGLWCDIDVGNEGRKKGVNHPPDIDTAYDLLNACKYQPSLVVNSGRGLHAYWLFKEFWEFQKSELHHGTLLSHLWHRYVIKEFMGEYHVDTVSDMARPLRLVGTINQKYNAPCYIVQENDIRYNRRDLVDDFIPLADADDIRAVRAVLTPQSKKATGAKVTLDNVNYTAVAARINKLIQVDNKFADTYYLKRKDLKDATPSGYEFAIINQLVAKGWKADDEIIAACVMWRDNNELAQKGKGNTLRVDYYAQSIAKARKAISTIDTEQADEVLTTLSETVVDEPSPNVDEPAIRARHTKIHPPSNQAKIDAIAYLNDLFKTSLLNIVKYPADPPLYVIMTATATISAKIEDLTAARHFRNKIAALTGKLPESVSKNDWDVVVNIILGLCTEIDVGLVPTSQIEEWLASFLDNVPPITYGERLGVIQGQHAAVILDDNAEHVSEGLTKINYKKGEAVAVVMERFTMYVKRIASTKDLIITAQLAGWYPAHIYTVNSDNIQVARRVWVAPLPAMLRRQYGLVH